MRRRSSAASASEYARSSGVFFGNFLFAIIVLQDRAYPLRVVANVEKYFKDKRLVREGAESIGR
jgi:hypothetical protein